MVYKKSALIIFIICFLFWLKGNQAICDKILAWRVVPFALILKLRKGLTHESTLIERRL